MTKPISAQTLEKRLIEAGVDVNAREFKSAEAEAIENSALSLKAPDAPQDIIMPVWYEQRARDWRAFGQIGVLMQVMFIQGGLAPIMNVLLILVDTYRLFAVVSVFEPGWFAALLLSVGVMAAYTYISLLKADLKYALRKTVEYEFSLAVALRRFQYWLGWGRDWQPRERSQTEIQYRRVKSFAMWFKVGILVLLILHSLVYVVEGIATPTLPGTTAAFDAGDVLNAVTGAIGGVVVTMLLVIALDMQIERSYAVYMQTGGAAVASQDFFAAQQERYWRDLEAARQQARVNFLMMQLAANQRENQTSALTKDTTQ